MQDFVEHLRAHPRLGPLLVHHRRTEAVGPRWAEPARPLSPWLRDALRASGIDRLYAHQAAALDAARAGRNVLAVTPTASGKSLVFALPVLESMLAEPGSRALFLYPTKALAQDQIAGLRSLSMALGPFGTPRFEIYDGDTPDAARRRIKADPPEGLVTNPDMLHAGILARHQDWRAFLGGLRWIVLDELHVYRGMFGAHVHHILRRLRRLCASCGAHPRVLAASATIGNPAEFAQVLAGEPFTVVEESGAPRAAREVLFVNPAFAMSPYTAAVHLVAEAVRRGLRTIAFTKARRITELLHAWTVRQVPELAHRIAPYRAGYLAEERRRIEEGLFRGDLRAVLTTSALELGIDVGGLDVCVLVGWPGSRMAAWQRIGRVGRADRDSLAVLVAMPDALDQYVVAHPELFHEGSFERAVLDPWNGVVAGHHLVCAAAEEPLRPAEIAAAGPRARGVVEALEAKHRLVQDAAGERWFSFRRHPHREVSPRSTGPSYSIVLAGSGRILGTIDGMRVVHECHPGAIYLHAGQSYLVRGLDRDARRVTVEEAPVDHYTVVLGEKQTRILEVLESRRAGAAEVALGRVEVTVHVREYQRKKLFGGEVLSTHPLDLPPLIFETVGFWIAVPDAIPAELVELELHPMGGLHAAEHAIIGLFPLLAIADRGDLGGISYTAHPQVGGPAIFLYDGTPGGAGLAETAYRDIELLLRRTMEHVRSCGCESGCPACVQSPTCGNGNKPLDKAAAVLVLETLLGDRPLRLELPRPLEAAGTVASPGVDDAPRRHGITRGTPSVPPAAGRVLVFDLETQRSASEVGGWSQASRMRLALAVVYDVAEDTYRTYRESDVERLLLDLALADCVVGFNVVRFDRAVLSAYTRWSLGRIPFLDLLTEVRGRLGFRLSLGHLAEVNLGRGKSADGLTSLRWWRQGRVDLIEEYCRQDVEITRRLWELGARQRYLLYRQRDGQTLRLPVSW